MPTIFFTRLYHHAWFQDALALSSGMLMALSFAPLNFHFLAFICLALWLITLLNSTPRRAFWRGWLFGFGLIAVGSWWISIAILNFGIHSHEFALLFAISILVLVAIFWAIQAYCFVYFFPCRHWLKLTVVFALLCVIQEVIRTWPFGIAWFVFGSSQTDTWIGNYAIVMSMYGVTFMLALCAGLFVLAILKQYYVRCAALIILILLSGWLLGEINWTHPQGMPIKVSLLQGDITPSTKITRTEAINDVLLYSQLSKINWQSAAPSRIIVWPETAVTFPMQPAQDYFEELGDEAKQHQSALIIGTNAYGSGATAHDRYNAAYVFGNGKGVYLKRYLFPFGEAIPYISVLRRIPLFSTLKSRFDNGPRVQDLLYVGNVPIAPYICNEITFVNLLWPSLPQAQLLVTLVDDAWFNSRWESAQHLQLAQMRSLETGRYQLYDTDNGYTAIIDQHGHVVQQVPRASVQVLTGYVQPMVGATPLIKLGLFFWLWVLIGMTLISWIYLRYFDKKTK